MQQAPSAPAGPPPLPAVVVVDRSEPEGVRGLFEAGREAWPGLHVAFEAFVRQLAERGAAGSLAEVHAADLYLACACAERVPRAIEAFDRAHLARVGAYLSRLRPSAAFVEDVRQAVREKLFVGKAGTAPKIREYDGRAALASWLRVIAVRTAIDLQRASKDAVATHGDEDRDPPPPVGIDPEIRFIQQRYRDVFNAALRDAVTALDAEHREILRLHFLEGRTLDQLATALGVHRATVARRLKAAREAVLLHARSRRPSCRRTRPPRRTATSPRSRAGWLAP